jgi:SHS2 domain-containing protein
MSLLEEARERISRTEFGDKEDIIRRIKDRKIRLLNNVREVFKEVVLKEQQVNEGSLSLSQIMYSAEICPSSSERLAD